MARTSSDPAYLSATEALAAFQKRILSPLDVLDAQIKRIEAHGKALNILTYTFFERRGNRHALPGPSTARRAARHVRWKA